MPPQFPPVGDDYDLVEAWREAGLSLSSGGYPAPLTWGEIDAWQRRTGSALGAWECSVIHAMSRAYVNNLHAGTDPDAPCPYEPEQPSEEYAAAMRQKIKSIFR